MWRSMMMLLVAVLLLVLASSTGADEGDGGQAGAFLLLPVGARAAAMGGAYVSISDRVEAVHYNPAGLSQLQGVSVSASYAALSMDRVNYSGGVAWADQCIGAVALQVVGFGVGDIDGRDGFGEPTGDFDNSEMSVKLAVGRRLFGPVSAGLGVGYMTHTLADNEASAFTFQAGVLSAFDMRGFLTSWRFGASVSDLGGTMSWNTASDHKDDVPTVIRYGTSVDIEIGRVPCTLAVEGRTVTNGATDLLAGVEVWPHEVFTLRAGYDGSDMTFGGGVLAGSFDVDYAYCPDFLDEGATHRFGVTAGF